MTRAASHFDADNLLAARIYLRDPERYGGLDGAMCRWARMVIERIEGNDGPETGRDRAEAAEGAGGIAGDSA